jgi:hypothetical protein
MFKLQPPTTMGDSKNIGEYVMYIPNNIFFVLATPYTKVKAPADYMHQGPLYGDLDYAKSEAARITAMLVERGFPVISPIVAFHDVAIQGNLDPLDAKKWINISRPLRMSAAALIVAHVPGWLESEGVAQEVRDAVNDAKPVYIYNPLMPEMITIMSQEVKEYFRMMRGTNDLFFDKVVIDTLAGNTLQFLDTVTELLKACDNKGLLDDCSYEDICDLVKNTKTLVSLLAEHK